MWQLFKHNTSERHGEQTNKNKQKKSDEETHVPTSEEVDHFLLHIFQKERLGPEICIMMFVYIERVMKWKDVAMLPETWRRVCLGALILASKVWEDQSVWNVDFVHYFPYSNVADLRRLERDFLTLIEFNVGLKASTYFRYFVALQNFAKEQQLPEATDAQLIESVSHQKQVEMSKMGNRKTNSAIELPAAHNL